MPPVWFAKSHSWPAKQRAESQVTVVMIPWKLSDQPIIGCFFTRRHSPGNITRNCSVSHAQGIINHWVSGAWMPPPTPSADEFPLSSPVQEHFLFPKLEVTEGPRQRWRRWWWQWWCWWLPGCVNYTAKLSKVSPFTSTIPHPDRLFGGQRLGPNYGLYTAKNYFFGEVLHYTGCNLIKIGLFRGPRAQRLFV